MANAFSKELMNYVTKLVKILIGAFYQRNLESF